MVDEEFMCKQQKSISLIGDFKRFNQIPNRNFYGYDEQMKAGVTLGQIAAKGNFASIFVFGYQGIGKKAFPLAVANMLNREYGLCFSYIGIHCEKFFTEIREPRQAQDLLDEIQKTIEKNSPIIVALDELHYLSAEAVRINPILSILHMWVRLLLNKRPLKVIVMGITEKPQAVDKSIVQGFCVPLYFDITKPEIVSEIIEDFLKSNKSGSIATELIDQLSALNLTPMSSDLIRAISPLTCESVEKLSKEDVVRAIRRNLTAYVSKEGISQYCADNRELITLSRNYTIPFYSKLENEVTL